MNHGSPSCAPIKITDSKWSIINDERDFHPLILRGSYVLSVGFTKKRLNLVCRGKNDREFEIYKRVQGSRAW